MFEGLEELPVEIGQLSSLMDLSLRGNHSSKRSRREMGQFSKLETLNIQDNQLAELPTEIWKFSNLFRLYLHKATNWQSCPPKSDS